MNQIERADRHLYEDAMDLLCGDLIGEGETRKVYDFSVIPGYVIKVERDYSKFRNQMEFQAWESVCAVHSVGKWFAPILKMSASGRFLIMEKTRRPERHEWAKKLPWYLTDRKRENFGISLKSGLFVAHDYGHHNLHEHGMVNNMTKVNWENPE